MRSWIDRVWNDEQAFKSFLRTALKYVVGLAGTAMATGLVTPPGVGDSGWKIGLFLLAGAAGIPTKPIDPAKRPQTVAESLAPVPPPPPTKQP